jgi:hypothetical protein
MPAQLRQSGGASLPARMVSRTIRPLPRQRDLEDHEAILHHAGGGPKGPPFSFVKNIMLNQTDEIMIRSNLVGT